MPARARRTWAGAMGSSRLPEEVAFEPARGDNRGIVQPKPSVPQGISLSIGTTGPLLKAGPAADGQPEGVNRSQSQIIIDS